MAAGIEFKADISLHEAVGTRPTRVDQDIRIALYREADSWIGSKRISTPPVNLYMKPFEEVIAPISIA